MLLAAWGMVQATQVANGTREHQFADVPSASFALQHKIAVLVGPAKLVVIDLPLVENSRSLALSLQTEHRYHPN